MHMQYCRSSWNKITSKNLPDVVMNSKWNRATYSKMNDKNLQVLQSQANAYLKGMDFGNKMQAKEFFWKKVNNSSTWSTEHINRVFKKTLQRKHKTALPTFARPPKLMGNTSEEATCPWSGVKITDTSSWSEIAPSPLLSTCNSGPTVSNITWMDSRGIHDYSLNKQNSHNNVKIIDHHT